LRQVGRAALSNNATRREVARSYLFLLLGAATPIVATNKGGIIYCALGTDRGVGRQVFASGGYDDHLLACAVQVLEDRAGPEAFKGRTFIDIGANLGTSTIPAILRFGASDAIAFEPAPDAFKVLQCNVILNGLTDRVRLLPVALSDEPGVAELEIAAADSGDSRVRTGPGDRTDNMFGESLRKVISVSARRFDDTIFQATLRSTGLVWIDAQGHEAQILKGAQTLLGSDVPVVLEYWPYGLRRSGGLDLLHEIIGAEYTQVLDLRATMSERKAVLHPAKSVSDLQWGLAGTAFTDILLLK